MARRWLKRCAAAAVALILATAPAARTQTQTGNGNFQCMPLSGSFTDPCTGEEVVITSGQVCFAENETVDGSGGVHINFQFRSSFTGVGMTSGATYTEHDSDHETVNLNGNNLQSDFTVTQNYHVNTAGGDNNMYLKELFHITTNASGQVTSMTVTYQFGCR